MTELEKAEKELQKANFRLYIAIANLIITVLASVALVFLAFVYFYDDKPVPALLSLILLQLYFVSSELHVYNSKKPKL